MAKVLLVFLLITHFSLSIAQQKDTHISLGSSLSPNTNNSFLLSNSGQFAFGFYEEGNGFAIGIWFQQIKEKTVIWTANRDNQPVPSSTNLVFSDNGRLVLQDKQGVRTPVFDSSQPAASASMLDSGNFVLYNSNSTIIWQSFDVPTHTLLSGQRLASGKELVSGVSETNHSSGRFQLIMQRDGNLVQYPTNIQPARYYAYRRFNTSKFGGKDRVGLNLDPTGELKLVNSSGVEVRKIVAGRSQLGDKVVYRLTLDADGILRLYSHSLVQNASWMILWTSTTNRCEPIGLCGLNSYCVLIEQEPRCTCPPGFDFLDQSQKNLGCKRSTSFNGCTTKDGIEVSVAEINGVRWADNSYSPVLFMNETACKEECLRDCNCEFALFRNDRCRKQMFPLRFSRNRRSDVVKTIIKVHNGSSGATTTKVSKEKIETKKGGRMTFIVVACLTFSSIILLFSVILLFRSRRSSFEKISNESNEELMAEAISLRSFTYNKLQQATGGFIEPLGRGAFGTVFKGTIGQRAIAVKQLEKVVAEGEVEFQNETRSIGRIHHRNLLHLLGYCHEGSNRLLVYDYMSNGSLTNFLFNSQEKPKWDERVRIALGIARGILYLHEECESQIIHCDINPNNILIDESHSPKIADFGLAKLLMPDQTKTFTGVRGTRGFVAPEWHKNFPITAKVDVFSFGIVLLVIICCRRSVDVNLAEREAILADWVYECFKAYEVKKLIPDEVDEQAFERMVRIGLWCIQEEPTVRPAMKKVVAMIEGTVDILVPPCLTSSIHSHVTD
ncbi:hypothetical protein UlMin_008903 [Ulmus minor]